MQSQDLALDPQHGLLGGQEDFSAINLPNSSQNLQSLPKSNNKGSAPSMSTFWGPMSRFESRPPHTTLPKATPRPPLPDVATAPKLPPTRALARANLMSSSLALRRAVRAAGLPTQAHTAGVQQTLLQHISALQERVHALENHVDALNKTLERWDPNTWECLREMVQEMVQEHGQAEGEA